MAYTKTRLRFVDAHGETLIVGVHNGQKALVDPCDENIAVIVPTGRNAVLVGFALSRVALSCGRNALTITVSRAGNFGFASVRYSDVCVFLSELSEGQRVDILPVAEPAVSYAVPLPTLPVFYGRAAVQPIYAEVAA